MPITAQPKTASLPNRHFGIYAGDESVNLNESEILNTQKIHQVAEELKQAGVTQSELEQGIEYLVNIALAVGNGPAATAKDSAGVADGKHAKRAASSKTEARAPGDSARHVATSHLKNFLESDAMPLVKEAAIRQLQSAMRYAGDAKSGPKSNAFSIPEELMDLIKEVAPAKASPSPAQPAVEQAPETPRLSGRITRSLDASAATTASRTSGQLRGDDNDAVVVHPPPEPARAAQGAADRAGIDGKSARQTAAAGVIQPGQELGPAPAVPKAQTFKAALAQVEKLNRQLNSQVYKDLPRRLAQGLTTRSFPPSRHQEETQEVSSTLAQLRSGLALAERFERVLTLYQEASLEHTKLEKRYLAIAGTANMRSNGIRPAMSEAIYRASKESAQTRESMARHLETLNQIIRDWQRQEATLSAQARQALKDAQ